jgi:predicted Zn-dependent peptidase
MLDVCNKELPQQKYIMKYKKHYKLNSFLLFLVANVTVINTQQKLDKVFSDLP